MENVVLISAVGVIFLLVDRLFIGRAINRSRQIEERQEREIEYLKEEIKYLRAELDWLTRMVEPILPEFKLEVDDEEVIDIRLIEEDLPPPKAEGGT